MKKSEYQTIFELLSNKYINISKISAMGADSTAVYKCNRIDNPSELIVVKCNIIVSKEHQIYLENELNIIKLQLNCENIVKVINSYQKGMFFI